jgi:hypothetical protein
MDSVAGGVVCTIARSGLVGDGQAPADTDVKGEGNENDSTRAAIAKPEAEGVPAGAPVEQEQSGEGERGPRGFLALPPEEQAEVRELQSRDREVRAHEQAHVAAGGQYVRGRADYDYATGPDNRQYAVGGEVSIDTSPVPGDPAATITKARTIKRAAMAPAKPSSQDRVVAAKASQMEAEARTELARQNQENAESASERKSAAVDAPGHGGFEGKGRGNPYLSVSRAGQGTFYPETIRVSTIDRYV